MFPLKVLHVKTKKIQKLSEENQMNEELAGKIKSLQTKQAF